MIYIKKIFFLLVVMLLLVSNSEDANAKKYEYVNSNNGLRLRADASIEAEILTVLPYGKKIKILKRNQGEESEWVKVKVDGVKGYVHSDYIQSEDPLDGMEHLGKWIVTAYSYTGNPCANGNMPSEGYTIACNSLPFGTKVYISGVGFRVVEDRGPSWMGYEWCDLYLGSYSDCVIWGAQSKNVWIVKEN